MISLHPTQQIMFDLTEGERNRDEALKRVLETGGEELRQLKWAIYRVACRQEYLTSDDAAEEFLKKVGRQPPRRASMMGAAFRCAAEQNIIKDTGRMYKSCRKAARGRKITAWRSLIWKKEP